jgi:uncharacterized membrane protein
MISNSNAVMPGRRGIPVASRVSGDRLPQAKSDMKKAAAAKENCPATMKSFDAHHRFAMSCILAVVVFIAVHGHVTLATEAVLGWNVFATSTIVLAWIVMSTKDPYDVRRGASIQDASQTFLFTVVISAATISLFAVFVLLGSTKGLSPTNSAEHIALSVSAIALSWTLVHTLFSLRYAHLYYFDAHKLDRDKIQGGLLFPEDNNPDYLDFAYFSFVIGMTCQVSDVNIASKRIRRVAIIHGLISFAFNTAILAMIVNIIAGLI